ncbi:MAG: sulfotransferase [Chitinophagaceae bacterium]
MKIDIAIAGFQKAGTTSISNYLGCHDEIQTHPQREMTYFSLKEEFELGENAAQQRYFPKIKQGKKLLIKHATLHRYEDSIRRLYENNPACKIIVCLRNPAERAYSSYLMEKANGTKLKDFHTTIIEAFQNHNNGKDDWNYNVFIKLGEYVKYIPQLLKYFSANQVYFIRIEKFNKDSFNNMNRLCDWLGIAHLPPETTNKKYNSFKVERNKTLTRMLKILLSKKSWVKRIGKKIIPSNKHYLFSEKLDNISMKKGTKEIMNPETRIFLDKHFIPLENQLNELLQKEFKELPALF